MATTDEPPVVRLIVRAALLGVQRSIGLGLVAFQGHEPGDTEVRDIGLLFQADQLRDLVPRLLELADKLDEVALRH
jgi:hypothetical protein